MLFPVFDKKTGEKVSETCRRESGRANTWYYHFLPKDSPYMKVLSDEEFSSRYTSLIRDYKLELSCSI